MGRAQREPVIGDPRELLKLVSSMRAAQRRYFRTRLRVALVEARQLEGQVDRALEEWNRGQSSLPFG